MKDATLLLCYSLREPCSFTVEFDRASLRHSHVAAGQRVLYPGRDHHLQVRHLTLHRGGVDLAHVRPAVRGLNVPEGEGPGVLGVNISFNSFENNLIKSNLVIVSYRQPVVVSYNVVVNCENRLGV